MMCGPAYPQANARLTTFLVLRALPLPFAAALQLALQNPEKETVQ